jgi:hypothetical protein
VSSVNSQQSEAAPASRRGAAPVVDDLMLKVKVEVDLCFVFDMIQSDKSVNLIFRLDLT